MDDKVERTAEQAEALQTLIKDQVNRLICILDEACKKIDQVLKTCSDTSDEQRSYLEAIKTTLTSQSDKLKQCRIENLENMKNIFQEVTAVVSEEMEKAFEEIKEIGAEKFLDTRFEMLMNNVEEIKKNLLQDFQRNLLKEFKRSRKKLD